MQLNLKSPSRILLANCLAIILFTQCKSQEPLSWERSSEWKIYDIHMRDYFKLSASELEKQKSNTLDSFPHLLKSAARWPKDSVAVWQSTYSTSCVIDKKIRKVIFSSHGGFFYDVESERYYSVPPNLKKELKSYLQQRKLTLVP